jgi:hypothetical protein
MLWLAAYNYSQQQQQQQQRSHKIIKGPNESRKAKARQEPRFNGADMRLLKLRIASLYCALILKRILEIRAPPLSWVWRLLEKVWTGS